MYLVLRNWHLSPPPPFLTIFSKFLISFPVNILATFCLPLENFFMEVNFFTWTNKVYKVTLKDWHHAELVQQIPF